MNTWNRDRRVDGVSRKLALVAMNAAMLLHCDQRKPSGGSDAGIINPVGISEPEGAAGRCTDAFEPNETLETARMVNALAGPVTGVLVQRKQDGRGLWIERLGQGAGLKASVAVEG
jgi:hypothetical protein